MSTFAGEAAYQEKTNFILRLRESHNMNQSRSRVSMRRGLLFAGILFATCGALWAQNDAPPAGQMHGRGNPERELQHLTQVLSLTPDQQTQVKGLLAAQRQTMEELRKASGGTDAATQGPPPRQQMEAIRNDTDTKINALLNDDQKTKFAAWQAERKARMEHRGGPDGAAPPPPPGA
jgi:Spy/CpxP family protein refolding chaperone